MWEWRALCWAPCSALVPSLPPGCCRAGGQGLWPVVLGGQGHGHGPAVDPPGGHTVCFCRARCWQPGTRTPTPSAVSEDCLYLNVFVPQNVVSAEPLLGLPCKLPISHPQSPQLPAPPTPLHLSHAPSAVLAGPEWLRASSGSSWLPHGFTCSLPHPLAPCTRASACLPHTVLQELFIRGP